MHYIYESATGRMIGIDGKLMATGYAGHGAGVNNPALEAVVATGPLPRGEWRINLTPLVKSSVGALALALTPVGHSACGRSLFRIHGDTKAMNKTASHGCIILPRAVRQAIISGGVTKLMVV